MIYEAKGMVTVRSIFAVNDKELSGFIMDCPFEVGCSIGEILRAVMSLQTANQ